MFQRHFNHFWAGDKGKRSRKLGNCFHNATIFYLTIDKTFLCDKNELSDDDLTDLVDNVVFGDFIGRKVRRDVDESRQVTWERLELF